MTYSLVGVWELIVLMLGSGLPLGPGVPPLREDPKLLSVAPPEALVFTQWFGAGEPRADSENALERLMAEPEVQRFGNAVCDAVCDLLEAEAPEASQRVVRQIVPMLKLLYRRPGCLFLGRLEPSGPKPVVEAALVLNAGPELEKAQKFLEDLQALLKKEAQSIVLSVTHEVQGVTFHRFPHPITLSLPPVAWGVSGKYVIVAVGEKTPAAVMKRLRSGGGLAGNETFQALAGKVKTRRPTSRSYINVRALLDLLQKAGGPQATAALQALGLTAVTAVVSESGLEGQDFVGRTFASTEGTPTGLVGLCEGRKPLTEAELSLIPQDATFACAFKLDLAQAYEELCSVIEKIGGQRARREFVRDVEEDFQRELGIRLLRDFFDPLGDAWVLWNSPGDGGLLITGLTLLCTVDDHQRLSRTLERFAAAVREETGPRFRPDRRYVRRNLYLNEASYKGEKIYYLNPVGVADDFPLAPSWCLTEKYLVVSLFPQNVKAFLARSQRPESSILKRPDVGQVPRSVAFWFLDTAEWCKVLYPFAPVVGTLLFSELQRGRLDLTPEALPTARAVLPHLRRAVGTLQKTEGGFFLESKGTLPMGMPALGASFAATVFITPTKRLSAVPVPMPGPPVQRRAVIEPVKPEKR